MQVRLVPVESRPNRKPVRRARGSSVYFHLSLCPLLAPFRSGAHLSHVRKATVSRSAQPASYNAYTRCRSTHAHTRECFSPPPPPPRPVCCREQQLGVVTNLHRPSRNAHRRETRVKKKIDAAFAAPETPRVGTNACGPVLNDIYIRASLCAYIPTLERALEGSV